MTTKPSSSRRTFLATLGVGGVAATVALSRQATVPTPTAIPAAGENKGYQVTDHVRNYYRTAKV